MKPSELSPKRIAREMGLSEAQLWYFARNNDANFKPTRKQNVNGKVREIDAPLDGPKRRFQRLRAFFDMHFRPPASVHGGVTGKSYVTSARCHTRGNAFVVTRDIQDAYPSITRKMLRSSLLKLGFHSRTAEVLALLFTVNDRIPQGSPISSDALNFYLGPIDQRLASAAGRQGASYTRVFDDFIVSTNSQAFAAAVGNLLDSSIEREGLRVSAKKKRARGIQPRHGLQLVHGLVVNSRRGLRVNPEQWHRMLKLADEYVRSARRVQPDSLPALASKRSRLAGFVYCCRQIDISPAAQLNRQLETGDRLVRQRLLALGLSSRRGKWWVVAYGKHHRIIKNEPARLQQTWHRIASRRLERAAS